LASKNDNTVVLEGAQITYRNFEGRETAFNQKGSRNFAVLLNDEDAATLAADGWNVKYPKERPEEAEEEGYIPHPFLPVALRFDIFPPRIVLITERGRNPLDEKSVEMLDWADIVNVDLVIRPYAWELPNGKKGIKAYLKTMFVTIDEDPLEAKYAETDPK
jgi:hypothetical protein